MRLDLPHLSVLQGGLYCKATRVHTQHAASVYNSVHLRETPAPSTIIHVMKKILLGFMLVMLPLQVSWGVVSMYCQPEKTICIEACYTDAQEPRVDVIDVAKQINLTSATMDQSEHSCQAPSASIISSSNQTTPSLSSSVVLQFQEALLNLPALSERPERPQWFIAA